MHPNDRRAGDSSRTSTPGRKRRPQRSAAAAAASRHDQVGTPLTSLAGPTLRREAAVEGRQHAVGSCTAAPALSEHQQHWWLLDTVQGPCESHHCALLLRLEGKLDWRAFGQALQTLLARHAVLRTCLHTQPGPPHAVTAEATAFATAFDLTPRSLAGSSAETCAANLDGAVHDALRQPFDLRRGPLLRAMPWRLGEARHAVLLVAHRMACDGPGLAILAGELGTLYAAFAAAERPVLPPLRARSGEREPDGANTTAQARLIEYWRHRLAGQPALELPRDHGPASGLPHRMASTTMPLPPALTARLRSLAQDEGVTLFMLLLAAYKVLLMRISGQTDLSVLTPMSARSVGDLRRAVPLRTDLSGQPTFRQLLARVRDTTLQGMEHMAVPTPWLLCAPGRNGAVRSRSLAQAGFALERGVAAPRFRGLRVQAVPVCCASPGALDLVLTETAATLRADLAFDAAAFGADTARRWLLQFRQLLDHFVADPDQAISACDIAGAADRQRALHDWNRSDKPYPRETRTDELVTLQTRRSPNALAVCMGTQALSYAELEAQAQGLAQQLTQRGVAAGQRVGLCLQPAPELLIALLAVMKSGAAFVVLDPAWSRERLAFVVGDAGLALVLTQGDAARALPALPDLVDRRLDLGLALRELPPRNDSQPAAPAGSEHLACLVYTAGGSGRLHGVEVTHRGLTNWLWAMRQAPGCGADDVLLSLAAPSAIGALLEYFLPLIVGARLELVSREEAGQPALLLRRLQAGKPTLVQATPSVWRSLVDAGWSGSRKLVALSAGEPLPHELATRLVDRVGALWNLYGAAESSGWCLAARVQRGGDCVSLGRPIANARAYIVDEARRPVVIGMPGELCIGGDAVAGGIRGEPDAGAAHFIADPFSADPESRLLATGDLARHRADGQIELLGRLRAHGTLGLVSLHSPKHAVDTACSPRSAPRSTLEFQLLIDWRVALGNDAVGVDGDFFAHGGSAPQAEQLLARIATWSRRGLSLAELFLAPTVAAMARHLARSGWAPPWQAMVALRSSGTAPPVFLVAPVDGNVLQFGGLARTLGDNQPCYALQLQGQATAGWAVSTVTAMAARCVSEIRSVHAAGPCCVAGAGNGCVIAFEVAQQLLAQGVAVRLVLFDNGASPGAADALHGRRWQQGLRRAASACWQGLRAGRHLPAAGHASSQMHASASPHATLRHDLLRALQQHRPRPASLPLLHVLAARDPAGANHGASAVWQGLAGVGYQRAEVALVADAAWFGAPHDEPLARLLAGFARQASTIDGPETSNPPPTLAGGPAS